MDSEKTTPISETEQRIFDAAHHVFMQKGLDGAKMQEIADTAGINKSLLHYYFRSKEKLYETVAKFILARAVPAIRDILEADLPLEQKLRRFIDQYITLIRLNPYLPVFIISEINKHPERFFNHIMPKERPAPEALFKQIQAEIAAGKIRPIEPHHLLANIVALCAFPFIAKPMLMLLMGMSENEWAHFADNRKEAVFQFVSAALKPN